MTTTATPRVVTETYTLTRAELAPFRREAHTAGWTITRSAPTGAHNEYVVTIGRTIAPLTEEAPCTKTPTARRAWLSARIRRLGTGS